MAVIGMAAEISEAGLRVNHKEEGTMWQREGFVVDLHFEHGLSFLEISK